ncbi:DUF92 domain-containing protein [Hymenobacter tibetensis]|uniref:DUF92 domain-containing protein n=1 Tax=Hymenobacter tibetensis TaxID=497967 RepID=A0ABY4D1H3_9BACT|nr:DUF92 domain-containing protein [Hymenobacter tibetensis]UOG76384.1 DUF92 domain-containing protein [Hymenobacter tibetensis]
MSDLYSWCVVLLVLGAGMVYSVRAKKLTVAGSGTGGVLGVLLFLGAGFTGLLLLSLFFLLGTAASGWKRADKQRLGLAEANQGRRTAWQALANAGVAGAAALLSWLLPAHAPFFQLLLAGSLAAATADTLASELGNVYGRRFYHVLTLQPDTRGRDGVISMEGTLAGLAGSALMASVYSAGFGWHRGFGWVLLAGAVGNLIDSVLGATLERRGTLSNNAVNLLNTLVGAIVTALCYVLWGL